ncbi:MAG: InlB B-repeat-containing protein, partial [Solirubrobacteraceae bacterium]
MTRVPSVRHIPGWLLACLVLVCAALGATAAAANAAPGLTLTVTASGTGSGVITSSPTGIDCGGGADAGGHAVCSVQFDAAVTSVALSATPDAGMGFGGFGGACSGTSCTVSLTANASVTATFNKPPMATITAP